MREKFEVPEEIDGRDNRLPSWQPGLNHNQIVHNAEFKEFVTLWKSLTLESDRKKLIEEQIAQAQLIREVCYQLLLVVLLNIEVA